MSCFPMSASEPFIFVTVASFLLDRLIERERWRVRGWARSPHQQGVKMLSVFLNASNPKCSPLSHRSGNFKAADEGNILKKFSENEMQCFEKLRDDVLFPFVPGYHGVVEKEGESFLHMTDLLANFDLPNVMDCKMGVRYRIFIILFYFWYHLYLCTIHVTLSERKISLCLFLLHSERNDNVRWYLCNRCLC